MTAENIPQLSEEQRRAGTQKSLRVRRERARLKEQLQQGELTLASFMDRDDAQGIRVRDMLCSMPNIGRVKAAKIMQQVGIAERTRLQGLGCRQKQELLDMFG